MDQVLELQNIAYEESDELCWSTQSDCNILSCNAFDLYPGSQDE
jgi:hypothetical protein